MIKLRRCLRLKAFELLCPTRRAHGNAATLRLSEQFRIQIYLYTFSLFFLAWTTPALAHDARQEVLKIQKQKSNLLIQQKHLLDEIGVFKKNLEELSLRYDEKKRNLIFNQEEIAKKLPLLARLERSHPLKLLVDVTSGQNTLRAMILVRAFTNSLKHQLHQVQAEMNEIKALSQDLEKKTQSYQKLLQGVEFEQTQLTTLESQKIDDYKKAELERLAKEDDINTLLEESRATLSKNEAKAKKASIVKGLPFRWLERPVAGKMIKDPALQNKFSPQSQGVIFETKKKAEVLSPSKGKIVFKGPFRNQGDILIIDHGSKVFTILMGMHKIDAQIGQNVYAGEKIGIMAGYGSKSPKLYIELRQNGKAIDPKAYFAD